MRKFTFLFAVAISLAGVAAAQPTLTSATNAPVVGDVLYFHDCDTNGVTIGASGASVTWNYSTLASSYQDTTVYITCATSPNCDSFPGSNIVATDPGRTYFNYYNVGTSAFSYIGYSDSSFSERYQNALDFYYFPMTYNGTHTDTAYHDAGASDIYQYTDTFKCDGWGTLSLPGVTYSNVLRVHEIQHVTETLLGTQYRWKNDYYLWFVAGVHAPVLYMGLDTAGASAPYISYVGYVTRLSTSTPPICKTNISFSIAPNPATTELNLETNGDYFNYGIINSMGMEIYSNSIKSESTVINIEQMPAGVYYIKLSGPNGNAMSKFIKL